MGFASDSDILRIRLQTEWGILHPDMPISWENVAFTPPHGQWVRFTIKNGTQERQSISDTESASFKTIGSVIVEVFTLAGLGTGAGDELVDDVSNIFRGFYQDSIRCRAPAVTFSGKNGKYWKNIVHIPFVSYESHGVNI